MKYKIIKAFGSFINLQIGEVREFTEAEAIRYAHFLEPVNSESVNSTDIKPNKMHKKGERKMKKIIALLLVFGLTAMGGTPLIAAERELAVYGVALGTYGPTEVYHIGALIPGVARIHHIIITNDDASQAQTVTFYSLGDSTTTLTSEFVVDIASTDASVAFQPVQIPFPIPASPWAVDDLLVRKSSLLSTVRITVFYR